MRHSPLPLLLLTAAAAHATPSGLNNIPTADTVPHRTVAVQLFDTFGAGPHDLWAGFKSGWAFDKVNVEFGLDSHLAPDPAGPLYLQSKVAVSLWEGGAVSVGVANVGLTNRDRDGDVFTYAVITQDLKFARLTAGYGWQEDNNTVLLGIDRTFKVGGRNLNLNADFVQTGDGDGWILSAGAKYDLSEHIVLESWVNFPDEGETSFVTKLNYVFKF